MSAHHYFRDFAYCDSGMIPWMLIAELVSKSGRSLADLIANRRAAFPSSGEVDFMVDNPDASIAAVRAAYGDVAEIDEMGGLSLACFGWRIDFRKSNTERLVRLHVEASGSTIDLGEMVREVGRTIRSA